MGYYFAFGFVAFCAILFFVLNKRMHKNSDKKIRDDVIDKLGDKRF